MVLAAVEVTMRDIRDFRWQACAALTQNRAYQICQLLSTGRCCYHYLMDPNLDIVMIRRITSGSAFESAVGFSRAVVDDRYVHVSGTTGFDYTAMQISDSPAEQCHQCFRNIANALGQAGCSLDDVVRVRYYFTNVDLFEELAPICATFLAAARPAATAIVCQLVDRRMKVEIEVTALLPLSIKT